MEKARVREEGRKEEKREWEEGERKKGNKLGRRGRMQKGEE